MFNFGFQKVAREEKTRLVSQVFSSVANKYDVMNNVMSLGLQKVWKRNFADFISIEEGGRYLDLASGTGDIAFLIMEKAKLEGKKITIVLCDENEKMLELAKPRFGGNVEFVVSSAEELPFEEGEFDGIFISFGIRNFTDIELSASKIHRSLKQNGDFYILEFFPDVSGFAFFDKIYKSYLLNVIPKMGKIITKDEGAYRYFGESILNFHSKKNFKNILQKQNFRFFSIKNEFLDIVSFFHFKK
jgi:demethylmenaquinone methyltransferase/2-methoxy-6-polyprenyl-1,4-benzoquinol methylase